MSDLDRYVQRRAERDPDFAEELESGYADFKIGVMLRDGGSRLLGSRIDGERERQHRGPTHLDPPPVHEGG